MERPSLGLDLRELETATLERPHAASAPLLSGGETLLEGLVLGLPGPIDEKPAEQARTGAEICLRCGVYGTWCKQYQCRRRDPSFERHGSPFP